MPGHSGGRAGRAARWRAAYWDQLEQAGSDLDRLAVAVDYMRVVIKHCVPAAQRRTVVDTLLAELTSTAEDHLTHYEDPRRKAS